jgi:hypothetical protein
MKKLNILILTLTFLLLSSCGAEFRLVSYAQSNQVSASSVSTSFGPSLTVSPGNSIKFSVYSNPRLMFGQLDPWDFGLWNGMWTHCRAHGFHDLSMWDPTYSPLFCRPSRDFIWAIRGNHRWSLFGYDRWGYFNHYGWNGIYNPYQGWPYWNNNVYASPYWRQNRPNRVYINGRRGSSNVEVQNNRRRVNTTTRRYDNSNRNNEIIINRGMNNNNNRRIRVYERPENNPNNRVRINTKPRVNENNRPTWNNSNNTRPPVIRNSSPTRSNSVRSTNSSRSTNVKPTRERR